mmetsp:Transcript_3920/g.7573  ORF Transcript_3920/g.7573 Transcript_3920/m.7573 type:complete len:194 (-) Transcript_3920:14-595(-)
MLPSSAPDSTSSGSSGVQSVQERVQSATSAVRAVVGMQTEAERNDSLFPDLTMQQRLYGVLACFSAGLLVSALSSMFLWSFKTRQFAVFYTIGNILAMGSTLFLVGPRRQCTVMFKNERRIATCVYFFAMFLTLITAFSLEHAAAPCLVLIIIQFSAGVWYTLSFIPFARQSCKSCFMNNMASVDGSSGGGGV